MTLYLKNATFLDWQTLKMTEGHLAVEEGPTGGVSSITAMPVSLRPQDRVLDCGGKLVTKSFGCGHHHIYSALSRGMPAPEKVPTNFEETLAYVWWRLDRLLDLEMIRASALVTALYCLKNGVTFVIDHHASTFAIEGSLETIARAFDEVGLSHLLCYEMSDRDGETAREQGLAETGEFLESGHQGHVGLHASFTVGDDLLKKAVALAQKHDAGIHVHVAEDVVDQARCLKEHGKRVVERFGDAGVLDLKKSILSHCIHLDAAEVAKIRESGVWVAQNTESNLNNNVGVTGYGPLGPNIILGTDGMHSDMLRSAKAAYLTGQAVERIDMAGLYRRFRNIHRYIRDNGFSGDGDNNLVVLDYDAPTEVTGDNFLGHFIYGLEARHVESVISSGRLVVHDRKLLTADQAEILGFAREMGNKLWKKMTL